MIVASLDDLFGALGEPQRVLFGTDDFVAGAALMGLDERWLLKREAAQLSAATHVVAISPVLAERWQSLGASVDLIPNGVDARAYRDVDATPAADDVTLSPPIVGFVGHLSSRIDFDMLQAIAEAGHSLLLVGPASRVNDQAAFDRLLSRPNVQWMGRQPFERLPAYLRCIDVGVTPYADSAFNRASFPLKTLEYLAAGRGAVATGLPSTRWLDSSLVRIADDVPSFVAQVEAALEEGNPPALRTARRALAADHSWDLRMRQWTDLIQLPRDPR